MDGHGFRATPFFRSPELSDALGFDRDGGVWVKDETGNVSGSHKGRHLMGVLIHLAVMERCGLARPRPPPGPGDRQLRKRGPGGGRGGPGRRLAD